MVTGILAGVGALIGGIVVYDLLQRKHAILRNFPVVGHFRYLLEAFGPELRQYIVTNNNEERPFSRDQRRWVYASSKLGFPDSALLAFALGCDLINVGREASLDEGSPFHHPEPVFFRRR